MRASFAEVYPGPRGFLALGGAEDANERRGEARVFGASEIEKTLACAHPSALPAADVHRLENLWGQGSGDAPQTRTVRRLKHKSFTHDVKANYSNNLSLNFFSRELTHCIQTNHTSWGRGLKYFIPLFLTWLN